MPASTEGPTVALSFANNFWGKDDAGVHPLLDRMAAAKQTNDELRSFYSARASIEDDYARKLMSLCRKSLGSHEMGSLKTSLDTVRGEVESMAKQHAGIAAQMKTELEEPLAAFAGGMKERRKIIQNTVEKLLKVKIQQTQTVNKTRDRYEQECLKIKGYLAQGHMVMGQEERKNKAKLEKTQISVATTNTEYENAVKALEDTTARWNREWKAAADKFQDLEEERLDFTKSSLWTFANIASTVCVSDDASCEKIRLSLESMDVENDIIHFITEKGTGQEIPDPPKYINFCRGDVEDHPQPEPVEEDNYSVAQFPRSINPAFRSSSPQPSTFESHHDPNSALARDLGHHEPIAPLNSREPAHSQQKSIAAAPPAAPAPPTVAQHDRHQNNNSLQHYNPHHDQMAGHQRELAHRDHGREVAHHGQRGSVSMPTQGRSSQDRRHGNQVQQEQYDAGQFAEVPHDPYPMDGMTMLCRTDGMNSATSSNLSGRPSSRDDNSDYSNPTSLSSQELPSGKVSPTKQEPAPQPVSPSKQQVMKKKSGFFQNHSPFRRKSVKEVQQQQQQQQQPQQQQPQRPQPPTNRNTWGPMSAPQGGNRPSSRRGHGYQPSEPQNMLPDRERAASPEPIDANASLALNVGQNVFPVAQLDARKKSTDSGVSPRQEDQDPIAMALAELKGVAGNKHSVGRISADHYHGIATPAPDRSTAERPQPQAFARTKANSSSDVVAAVRGTPPPSYDQQIQRLGVPPPAVTSRAMQESSRKYTEQTREMFKPNRPASVYSSTQAPRPNTRGSDVPRAASPAPTRTASPRPGMHIDTRQPAQQQQQATQPRSASPNPYASSPQSQTQAQRAPSPNPYSPSQPQPPKTAPASSYGGGQGQLQKAIQASPYSSSSGSGTAQRQAQKAESPNPYSGGQSHLQKTTPSSYGGGGGIASAGQNQQKATPSPNSSFTASQRQIPTAAPASPTTYSPSQTQAPKAAAPASPSTYGSANTQRQNTTKRDASPNPYTAGSAQRQNTKRDVSPNPYSATPQQQVPKAATATTAPPSTYSSSSGTQRHGHNRAQSQSQSQAQRGPSPNPYSQAQSTPKAAPAPLSAPREAQSSYGGVAPGTPRQRAQGSASPNPYTAAAGRQSQAQAQAQAQVPRAASPNPPYASNPRQQSHRVPSPNPPYASSQHRGSVSSQRGGTPTRGSMDYQQPQQQQGYYGRNSPNDMAARAASPSVFRGSAGAGDYGRPSSSRPASRAGGGGGADMAIQLAPTGSGDPYGSMRSSRSGGRPGTSSSSRTMGGSGGSGGFSAGAMTFYDGRDPMQEGNRQRSQSVADPSRQYTRDGRAILHYARAMYMYQAAIPEELGFNKGDILAVLRHQDDGWWEAEIHSGNGVGMNGLVPSNYLQVC